MLAVGFPIYMALITTTIYLQVFVNQMPLNNMFTGLILSLTTNSLLAIPFFILAGNLMAVGTLGSRLMDVCRTYCKKLPGGLAMSGLGANAIFAAISGSAPAAVATFGRIIWDPLREEYGEKEAAGLINTGSLLSVIIPPSIPIIIFGLVSETSIARLFLAGFIPGILSIICIGIYLLVKYRKSTTDSFWVRGERTGALKRGIPAILLPVIVLGGIYGGFCTPTEAGAIATMYALVVSLLVLRDVKPRQLPGVLLSTAKTVAVIFILIATSNVFSQALAVTQAPRMLETILVDLSPIAFLLLVNVILLILGLFLEPSPCILILTPLLLPAAVALGIDPIHFGIIFVINVAIGIITPPVGLCIFVAVDVLKRPMSLIARGSIPYVVCYLIVLVLVTFNPGISMFLPRLLSGI